MTRGWFLGVFLVGLVGVAVFVFRAVPVLKPVPPCARNLWVVGRWDTPEARSHDSRWMSGHREWRAAQEDKFLRICRGAGGRSHDWLEGARYTGVRPDHQDREIVDGIHFMECRCPLDGGVGVP